ncbi:MAG: GHMP kinase [Methylobacteriaceae bacterium]|nr:GHMP kinase [Methylobacteriaceae bacterium]MBV9634083.1 GHMP kinase [Methylobacteriaceae bacterium]
MSTVVRHHVSASHLDRKRQQAPVNGVPAQVLPGVSVTVPARLHLGFLDLNGDMGRRFGSVGLAIDGLRTRLTLRPAAQTQIIGRERHRAARHLATMTSYLGLTVAHHLSLDETIPAHAGLGSGTQLALAVAAAVRRLNGLALDVPGDAMRLARGARSGIGIGLFERGGLIVDAGRGPATEIPPVVSRMPLPEDWRILVILDPSRQGIHGEDERNAFGTLPPMAAEEAAHLCRLVLMQALPALAERDIMRFGAAIKEMQSRLGQHFAPRQGGGAFTSAQVGAVLDLLDRGGAHGIGQSSWGPTGFAFAATQDEAERLARIAADHTGASGLDIRIASGLNRGAEVKTVAASNTQVP